MRLQLAANSVSVWVQLRWLGFPFHVAFHPGLHPAWWSQGSKRANPSAQALACLMFVDISLAKVSHMAYIHVDTERHDSLAAIIVIGYHAL